ncbi:hypothetical protein KIN20_006051 [Parelaphostrongylus tenuis]|uniref:Uncharacterized protein n=1 Tax=Parelaphostrongylus tenuis TaxID=148309 RepID=A0AAD5QJ26_PARTN|nr:hypothetical protein KIN20_006051 [Parelaphostrongylus tenuis]
MKRFDHFIITSSYELSGVQQATCGSSPDRKLHTVHPSEIVVYLVLLNEPSSLSNHSDSSDGEEVWNKRTLRRSFVGYWDYA